ncbi:MAG: hypothetical protein U0Z17_01880 [Bacteroidales bacterium]
MGAPGLMLVVWVITGLMTIFAALSYGELLDDRAGGQYVYIREALIHWQVSFMAGLSSR